MTPNKTKPKRQLFISKIDNMDLKEGLLTFFSPKTESFTKTLYYLQHKGVEEILWVFDLKQKTK